jgi:hypothetical protein
MVLKSSRLVLWKNSISHVFTSLCTLSSSDPAGQIFIKKLQQLKIKLIYIVTQHTLRQKKLRRKREKASGGWGHLSSAFFKELVDNTIVRDTKPPFGVLDFFFAQVMAILVLLRSA